jgi:DNA-binding transcriptional MerR regulator
MDDLITIGRFARLSGLTVGALRHYDKLGVLEPAAIDGETGYRRYRSDQLPQAWAIARLRELDLSLDEIRELLASGDLEVLHRHRARLEARTWRLQRAGYRLQRLIEGKDDLMAEPKMMDVDHRQLGVDAFNHVWTLLEREERTRAEDDELLHEAHASTYHWLKAPECRPENRARGEWICSRAYAVLGRGEPALHHARRCLELCEEHGIGDFDLAFAYEALARAHAVGGDAEAASRFAAKAREAAGSVADADDRDAVLADLATLALTGGAGSDEKSLRWC